MSKASDEAREADGDVMFAVLEPHMRLGELMIERGLRLPKRRKRSSGLSFSCTRREE